MWSNCKYAAIQTSWRTKGGQSAQTGSTLIELLIAILISGVVLVGVAIGVMSSIQKTAQARYQDIAASLAQEAIETMLRDRAELGWDNFVARYPAGSSSMYCLDEDSNAFEVYTAGSPCDSVVTDPDLNQDFTRLISVSSQEFLPGETEVEVVVTVEWVSGNISPVPKVVLTQTFRQAY